jgi:iron complex outermembrane receptor protein
VSFAKSETILSGEIGFKSTVADDRIRVNGAIYYYQIDDEQFTAIGGATNSVRLVNADKGIGKGFDLEAEMLFTENFLVSAGLSYNDTEIDDPNLRVAICGSGQCSVTDSLDANGFAIVDGNQFPQAPELILNFSARYTQQVDGGELFIQTDWARQSDTQFFLYESREYHSGDIYEGGLRAGFTQEDGRWEIAVFGRNITDEENLKVGIDFNNNTGFVNDRRIWGATFRMNFGAM